jgi:hypothetical protein
MSHRPIRRRRPLARAAAGAAELRRRVAPLLAG